MVANDDKLKKKLMFVKIITLIILLIWTIFLSGFFFFNYKSMKSWTKKLAESEAWASYNKDVLYRKWAAGHGGVYVPPTEKTPPSPYLSHIHDRDVISTEGKKLTLINPAYMTRQVHEMGKEKYSAKGHITSLQPIRPGNEPDDWEEKTLKLFNNGVKENVEIIKKEDGEEVLKAMRPLLVEKGCLKCHQYQGYEIGDIRGGLSVEVPMMPYYVIFKKQLINDTIIFVIIWLFGVIAIFIMAFFYSRNIAIVAHNEHKQRTLERQLQQSQKMEAVGQLAGGIAHDFNNMLGIIIGFAEMVEEELDNSSTLYRYSENIRKTGERAKDLVSQLNIFSRQTDMNTEFIDINDLIEEFLKLLKRTIGEHIEVTFRKSVDPLKIKGDKTQIEQIIMNLCVNSRDAMPNGGKILLETEHKIIDNEFCVSHPWAKPGEYVVIKVSDTGFGMDNETLSRIYDPFFTTKEIGKGTGLGLSVVFGIIQNHKGLINVYSVPKNGTIFSIFIPFASMDSKSLQQEMSKDQKNLEIGNGTILVAEDEELLRDMVSNILESAGYKLILVENGEEAVKVFKERAKDIDILLFDVMMPAMSGLKAYKKILEIKKNIPVLFASGYSKETLNDQLLEYNKYEIIWKPFSRTELLTKLKEVANKSRGVSA